MRIVHVQLYGAEQILQFLASHINTVDHVFVFAAQSDLSCDGDFGGGLESRRTLCRISIIESDRNGSLVYPGLAAFEDEVLHRLCSNLYRFCLGLKGFGHR